MYNLQIKIADLKFYGLRLTSSIGFQEMLQHLLGEKMADTFINSFIKQAYY